MRYQREVLLLMCTGIAIVEDELPAMFRETLGSRIYVREGKREVQFHWWQKPTLLPVQWDGSFLLCQWGCRDRRSRLPMGGWLSRDQIASGILDRPESAVIPANIGFDRGTWFLISEGIRGVVIPQSHSGPVIYMLTEPASNYYRNMTEQSPMMPVFVDQVI